MYITAKKKTLVQYDSYLSEILQLFYLLELISIIFAKIFAFKVIMYDVLLKLDVMKCLVSSHITWHL